VERDVDVGGGARRSQYYKASIMRSVEVNLEYPFSGVQICACSKMLPELVGGLEVPREVQKMVWNNIRSRHVKKALNIPSI
jgi:hypothetical protein